ncbi:hypothetical protein FNV43_RR04299 [Rhamnella rubrinervis]|uniref:Uncharacterized protein n=1 Tax=Rhamnella rubrinervis TaxID=2594499 RepID=A0A8K0HKR8_9ROSA|nr:hypothetical protein FNV43_RR04299 [Rhamnella rubrinervis]
MNFLREGNQQDDEDHISKSDIATSSGGCYNITAADDESDKYDSEDGASKNDETLTKLYHEMYKKVAKKEENINQLKLKLDNTNKYLKMMNTGTEHGVTKFGRCQSEDFGESGNISNVVLNVATDYYEVITEAMSTEQRQFDDMDSTPSFKAPIINESSSRGEKSYNIDLTRCNFKDSKALCQRWIQLELRIIGLSLDYLPRFLSLL